MSPPPRCTEAVPAPSPSPAALEARGQAAFVAQLGGIVEHSPWVAERAWQRRPFASWAALHAAMSDCIREAPPAQQLALLRAHPELAGREAVAGEMTPDSHAEQGRLGLMSLSAADMARLATLNARYRERFGYPFLVALRLHDNLASVFAAFEERLGHDPAVELPIALAQVFEVMRGRLARITGSADLLAVSPSTSASTAPSAPSASSRHPAESPP